MERPNVFAGVILLTPDRELILQLRDDNPAIVDPGKLSIFAGRLKDGETPEQGARRELKEETGLTPQDLRFFRAYQKDPARHGGAGVSHIYVVENVDPTTVDVHEGQGARVVSIGALTVDNTALISYDILQAFAQEAGLTA